MFEKMQLPFSKIIMILLCFSITFQLRISSAKRFNYHTSAEIQERIDELVDENQLLAKKTCSQSKYYSYLQIGTPSNTTLNAIIICNIHARQIIAAEICLNWVQKLNKGSIPITQYFIRLFYIANPNRQAFIDHQKDCIRKNQNNVDTNRNFPTDFNHWKVKQSNQTYGGKTPFDQPLSMCLNQLLTSLRPDLYVDIHSGTNSTIFYQEGVNNAQQISLLNEANKQICNEELKITTLFKDGETINGHIFADIKVRLSVPFSFLIETYLGPTNLGCFLMFNPSGKMKSIIIQRYTNVLNFMLSKVKNLLLKST